MREQAKHISEENTSQTGRSTCKDPMVGVWRPIPSTVRRPGGIRKMVESELAALWSDYCRAFET